MLCRANNRSRATLRSISSETGLSQYRTWYLVITAVPVTTVLCAYEICIFVNYLLNLFDSHPIYVLYSPLLLRPAYLYVAVVVFQLVAVTQIRGHIARSSPPHHYGYGTCPCIFVARRLTPSFLVDSQVIRTEVYTSTHQVHSSGRVLVVS